MQKRDCISGIHLDPTGLQFSLFNSKEIDQLSVCNVVSPLTFDAIGQAIPGGLYDKAMGPALNNDLCTTCWNGVTKCPGHMGHIKLWVPVYNPFIYKAVQTILKISCLKCFKLQIPERIQYIVNLQFKLIEAGYLTEALELDIFKSDVINSSSTEMVVDENSGIHLHAKIVEYERLLRKKRKVNGNDTRNSEAVRQSIINATLHNSVTKSCIHCKEKGPKIKFTGGKLMFTINKANIGKYLDDHEIESCNLIDLKSTNRIIFPDECKIYLTKIYQNDSEILKQLFPLLNNSTETVPTDIFFMNTLTVVPPIVRPINKLSNGIFDCQQTKAYQNILFANIVVRAVLARLKYDILDRPDALKENVLLDSKAVYETIVGRTAQEKMYNAWNSLQDNVNTIVHGTTSVGNTKIAFGLKELVEKKEGLIRMHMMGKRVNFAARTVITPDPNINVDEIGIPEEFALKLTYPVPVTMWNVAEFRKLVINGPDIHPGACLIEDSNGIVKLLADNLNQRQALAKTLLTPGEYNFQDIKIVHRHLINNDILLLNRQPTLHRPSIMAHKARILKGEKTFRLHYSNCKSYNADFDGDEMNCHVPQNELGRSEAYSLVNVANHYLVPKDGTPLGGLIQDHVISGVRLQIRGRFFNRFDYQQLVYQGLSHKIGEIEFLPPSIIKPIMLWSGKQVISTILINLIPRNKPKINLKSNSKINGKAWQTRTPKTWIAGGSPVLDNELSESEIIIRNGILLSGILDKNHYGATPYSLIHCVYELYGGECSTALLTSFSKLFTIYLQWEGFTLGVKDILVLQKADEKRTEIIESSRLIGNETTLAALDLPANTDEYELRAKLAEAYVKNPKFRVIIDRKFKSALDTYTNQINKTCLPVGLITKFPSNNLQLMVQSGAKGSTVNTMQISCLLGQIELEGKRPPLMISDRTLPCFSSFETSPKSGGFIDGRFMTGIQPEDFFFHCMAGREGLIDTAVKTSRSGYLQRCLIKHLEGLTVQYDMTVRDSDKCVIQYLYGEDGMDITKSQFLNSSQLDFLNMNQECILSSNMLSALENSSSDNEKIVYLSKKINTWKKNCLNKGKIRQSGFTQFTKDQADISVKKPNKISKYTGRTRKSVKLQKLWFETDIAERKDYNDKQSTIYHDTIISHFKPDQYFGALSEYLEGLIQNYVKKNNCKSKQFSDLIKLKYVSSLAAPGEPVGLLAAQSIGEPSTQMTLNTFHFAGRGDMNVTLGIPRLREILMMASKNIKTPSMDIPFLKNEQNSKKFLKKAEKLRIEMNQVTLYDVLESLQIKTRLIITPHCTNEYELIFNFLPYEAYKNEYKVRPKEIIKYMSQQFFKALMKFIMAYVKNKKMLIELNTEKTDKNTNDNDADADNIEPAEIKVKNIKSEVVDSDLEDEDICDMDADATEMKNKLKRTDENTYDDSENEENDGNSDLELDKDDWADETTNASNANDTNHENYEYDSVDYRWCKLIFQLPNKFPSIDFSQILKDLARKTVIYNIPNIKRAITFEQNNQLILKTDGINIQAMFKYDKILDLNKFYSNDIHAIAKTYGIEAASRVIVKEVQNVFGVYGITVDTRHLLLIASYMTFDGTYSAFNRRGLANSTSPLQQMSFETSLQFLRQAVFTGISDELNSPSSCLIVGQPCKTGTGASFDVINVF